jgi:hypothetical protein
VSLAGWEDGGSQGRKTEARMAGRGGGRLVADWERGQDPKWGKESRQVVNG